MNDNNAPEISEEEKERGKTLVKHRVSMLMDELKSLFQPEMRLTFIARHLDDPTTFSLLTEEPDFNEFLKWINTAKKIEPSDIDSENKTVN